MSVDSVLDGAFSLLLAKARREERQQVLRPGGIDFFWSGGGLPLALTAMDPILAEVPFPARLVWVHMYAGAAAGTPSSVVATIALQLTSVTAFGSYTPLSGSAALPTLSGTAVDLDLTDWILNLDTGDTLLAVPTAFTGTATWLALTLQLRPVEAAIGIADVNDNSGDAMTLNDGTVLEFRS